MQQQFTPEIESAIRIRAHQMWEEEGRPEGRHETHWFRAVEAFHALEPAVKAQDAVLTISEDVLLIDGIGPKIAKQLASVGIISVKQIAEMTPLELSGVDAKLGLKGRTVREAWLAQAKELFAGKAPRAKVDQAKVSKKK